MIWLLAAGLVPAATLSYGMGAGHPDPFRWLCLSILIATGLLWLPFRKA